MARRREPVPPAEPPDVPPERTEPPTVPVDDDDPTDVLFADGWDYRAYVRHKYPDLHRPGIDTDEGENR
jgi:hypothetical protein